ncbi:DPP IV N-terminal domain-containing protein, partial [Vibrio parahaemolyticus]
KFIWVSERNGYRNAYLYNLSGRLLNTLTNNAFDLQRLLGVEADGSLWYTAHDGKYPSQVELHKVKLDGSADERLTDPALSHAVQVDPT